MDFAIIIFMLTLFQKNCLDNALHYLTQMSQFKYHNYKIYSTIITNDSLGICYLNLPSLFSNSILIPNNPIYRKFIEKSYRFCLQMMCCKFIYKQKYNKIWWHRLQKLNRIYHFVTMYLNNMFHFINRFYNYRNTSLM